MSKLINNQALTPFNFQATLTAESTPVEATEYTELGTKE